MYHRTSSLLNIIAKVSNLQCTYGNHEDNRMAITAAYKSSPSKVSGALESNQVPTILVSNQGKVGRPSNEVPK